MLKTLLVFSGHGRHRKYCWGMNGGDLLVCSTSNGKNGRRLGVIKYSCCDALFSKGNVVKSALQSEKGSQQIIAMLLICVFFFDHMK